MEDIKQIFQTPDGKSFNSKAEAQEHVRRPKILEALMRTTEGNKELSEWLVDNREVVEEAFEIGVIRRVSKSDYNKLRKSLDALKEADNPKLDFIKEHSEVIYKSFRWPKVERLDSDEKVARAREKITEAANGNTELATWVVDNKDAVVEAYKAGKPKRVIPEKAAEALAAYRAKKAAEKQKAEEEVARTAPKAATG